MNKVKATINNICEDIHNNGFSKLGANELAQLVQITEVSELRNEWNTLHTLWKQLIPDNHLKDGGTYRLRRHSCFIQDIESDTLVQTPHRAHWQPTVYNALHGGFDRMFEPISEQATTNAAFLGLMAQFGKVFSLIQPEKKWFIEAHQFRITTSGGIGRPTPEGAHRDGVDFVVVMMLERHNVKGGETRVFNLNESTGVRFLMEEPLTTIMLDDKKVIHETTPIQPLDQSIPESYRDTLVLTFRAKSFQSPG